MKRADSGSLGSVVLSHKYFGTCPDTGQNVEFCLLLLSVVLLGTTCLIVFTVVNLVI